MSKKVTDPAGGAEALRERATKLGLYGMLEHWDRLGKEPWLEEVLSVEEGERARRSLERRIRNAKIGRFKDLVDFEWSWPTKIDREAIEELFDFAFLGEQANVIFLGPNGVGKTTLAQNLAYKALLAGHTVSFITASDLLHDLASQDGPSALARRIRRYVRPELLVIDEVGYLSYTSRHADLLFDVINRRNQIKSTVVTTNKPFAEWNEVFPNSTSVVALIDRLVHKAEILPIEGESYRLKEANERKENKAKARRSRKASASAQKKAAG